MALVSPEGRFLRANPATCRLLGRSEEDLVALSITDVTHPGDLEISLTSLRLAVAGRFRGYQLQKRYVHGDGHFVRAVLTTSLLRDTEGTPLYFFSQLLDLTELPRTGDRGPSDDTVGRLLRAETDERSRVARELHDGLGQILTSIALFAKTIENEVPCDQRRKLTALRGLADEALASTRSLAWSLRPVEMHGVGLLDSLGRLVQGVRDRAGLRVDFHAQGLDVPLPPNLETTVYRFVQEALVNVMRHAEANTVAVVLRRVGSQVNAVVEDDGVGFDATAGTGPGGGMGLLHMQERARLAGGEVCIESAPGKGTCVRLEVAAAPMADLFASAARPRG
jgi:PAS domain S-box-containing protein